MNVTTEVNDNLLKLIQDLHQQVTTLVTNNINTNFPNPTNTHNLSNNLNTWNPLHLNTIKYCWSQGAWSHTSMDYNMKKIGHKYAATLCDKMESVAINDIFSLKCRYYGPKRDILYYCGTLIFCLLSYYIISKDKGL